MRRTELVGGREEGTWPDLRRSWWSCRPAAAPQERRSWMQEGTSTATAMIGDS